MAKIDFYKMINNTSQKIELDRLKEVIPIMDLAKSLGLNIKGTQAQCYNGQAHKHNDRNFSLGLDVKRNRYKCFACGEQGSVIDLYKAIKGVEVKEAIKDLAEMAGITPEGNQRAKIKPCNALGDKSIKIMQSKPLRVYSDIYEELWGICGGLDLESFNYLKGASRGLTDETLNRFLICSVKDYQKADQHLKSKFSKEELRQAGVIGEKGNLIFYKHKIIIPFLSEGRIIFLQGRRLDEEQPKYLHISRPVPLFNEDVLKVLKKGDKIYICEGVFDAIMLEQNGHKAVAILGVNNFKPEMTDLFKGFEVILCLDNDEAGRKATKELGGRFALKGQRVSKKELPDGVKDITEYFNKIQKIQEISP